MGAAARAVRHHERSERYLTELAAEFPGFRLIAKADDPLSRLLGGVVRLVTLGGQSHYMTRYVTTLGCRVYTPSDWEQMDDAARYIVLRHEAVHLRQFKRLGWVGMAVLYTLPLMPLGLAYGRARIEWAAFAETLRATAEVHGLDAAASPALHARIQRQFTSGAYGFMWPFPRVIQRWMAEEMARIRVDMGDPER